MRRVGTLAALAAGVALAGAAGAAELEGLAPPGDCAEARTVRGEPEQGFDALDGFDVAGGPREHFDPVDVGGGPDDPGRFDPPAPPPFDRGPCEAAGDACSELAMPRGGGERGGVVVEPPPSTGGGTPFPGSQP